MNEWMGRRDLILKGRKEKKRKALESGGKDRDRDRDLIV